MNVFYIGLGSNIGNKELNLGNANRLLKKYFNISKCSSVYETEPLHFKKQNNFLNQVVKAQTTLNIKQIFHIMQNIESLLGKEKTFKYGPRNIDIDLLLFNNEHSSKDNITIPHPALTQRRFVLEPLSEIDPNMTIPPDNKNINFYLDKVKDQTIYNAKNKNEQSTAIKRLIKQYFTF